MPIFSKNTDFSMPRGDKPEFAQLGSSDPTPKGGSGGLYYKTPVKETEEEENPHKNPDGSWKTAEENMAATDKAKEEEAAAEETKPTVETPEEEADIVDDEVEVEGKINPWKIGLTALTKGMDTVYGTSTRTFHDAVPEKKVEEEVDDKTGAEKVDELLGNNPPNETPEEEKARLEAEAKEKEAKS